MSALLAYDSYMATNKVPNISHHGGLSTCDDLHSDDPSVGSSSLYEYEPPFPCSGIVRKEENIVTDLTQLLQESSSYVSGFDGLPSDSAWGISSPPSVPNSGCSSGFLSTTTSYVPSPPMSGSETGSEYFDLSRFCEPNPPPLMNGGSIGGKEGSYIYPTTPLSAPLSPEEQEIQDIVSSLQDDPPLSNNGTSSYTLPHDPFEVKVVQSGHAGQNDVLSSAPLLAHYLSESPVPSPDISSPSSTLPLTPPTFTPSINQLMSPCTSSSTYSDSHMIEDSPKPSKKRTQRRKMSVTKKKARKKEQNKTAALRYRQKKKEESRVVEERQEVLEAKNRELKKQVYGLEAEINYLKQLWTEITEHRQHLQLQQTNRQSAAVQ